MREWLSIPEILAAGLPDLPDSETSLLRHAKSNGWRSTTMARKRAGRGGGWEYHVRLLPPAAQARWAIQQMDDSVQDDWARERSAALWARYEALSSAQKTVCETRLQALLKYDELRSAGLTAVASASIAARASGVSTMAIFDWLSMVDGVGRADWRAALAPDAAPGAARAACHEAAWDFLKSDYLRPEGQKFSVSYRLMVKAAKKEGWSPIASERALRRRLDAEVPKAVQTLAREGRDKAKTLYPAQRRSRAQLTVMQAVNMDGHKIDVFVRVPWSDKPVRMYLIAIQDLYSGKIVAWRLADAETWEAVRLVIGDMVESAGIPDQIFLDNGRAFASHWITGQARKRFRFKVKEEDPRGLLTTLGVETIFTTPYSGQSKPIERAFRDLADMIARHPRCAGAYTGNKPDAKPENYGTRAIPLDDFREHVAEQIADHNAQDGRRAANCAGRSFDTTFACAMETAIVTRPTAAQRSLWLLAAEGVRAQKGSGEIHYQGNRYWHAALNQHAGRKVTIRFDPDALHRPVKVYDLDNVLICEAACIDDTGFRDVEAARHHGRARRDYVRAIAAQKEAHARLSAEQLADILDRGSLPTRTAEPIRPRVTRLAVGNLALDQAPADAIADDFEANFQRALSRVTGDASILEFPSNGGNGPKSTAYGSEKKGGSDPAP
jgi:putative transposase